MSELFVSMIKLASSLTALLLISLLDSSKEKDKVTSSLTFIIFNLSFSKVVLI